MVNEKLKTAVQKAGLTVEEFAEIVRVDPKTVQRWFAGTLPYPRHRAAITRALDLQEHDLWPQPASPNTVTTNAGSGQARAGSELIGGWAFADDNGAPDPVALLAETDGQVDVVDNSLTPILTRSLARALADQASPGRPVRVLVGSPRPVLEPLIAHLHAEVRVSDAQQGLSLLRAGETMLLSLDLPFQGYDPPTVLMLRRAEGGGLFDRLLDTIEKLWSEPDEILKTPEQLDPYLTNSDYRDGEEDQDEGGPDDAVSDSVPGEQTREESSSIGSPPAPPAAETAYPPAPEPGARRWPRRPA